MSETTSNPKKNKKVLRRLIFVLGLILCIGIGVGNFSAAIALILFFLGDKNCAGEEKKTNPKVLFIISCIFYLISAGYCPFIAELFTLSFQSSRPEGYTSSQLLAERGWVVVVGTLMIFSLLSVVQIVLIIIEIFRSSKKGE